MKTIIGFVAAVATVLTVGRISIDAIIILVVGVIIFKLNSNGSDETKNNRVSVAKNQ